MMTLIITLSIMLLLSLFFNVMMVWYVKSSLRRLEEKIGVAYTASEEASEIFSMIDTYKEHLNSVYEMPTFYGDNTLQSLLLHTGEMIEFIKKYDKVYSFTQPDLEEQLQAAVIDFEEYDRKETEA